MGVSFDVEVGVEVEDEAVARPDRDQVVAWGEAEVHLGLAAFRSGGVMVLSVQVLEVVEVCVVRAADEEPLLFHSGLQIPQASSVQAGDFDRRQLLQPAHQGKEQISPLGASLLRHFRDACKEPVHFLPLVRATANFHAKRRVAVNVAKVPRALFSVVEKHQGSRRLAEFAGELGNLSLAQQAEVQREV